MIQMLNGLPGLGNIEDKNLKFERIVLQIDAAEKKVDFTQITDNSTRKIVGVAISATDDDALAYSSLQLGIKAKEIFPRGFECKMLQCGIEVAPNHRYFIFHKAEDVDRDEIRGEYHDGDNYTAPYEVTIYLLAFDE